MNIAEENTSKRKVSFKNKRGQTLAGLLHGKLGRRCAISCHGMLSSKDGRKHELLADRMLSRGIPILRFDFAGRGDSEGSLFDMSYSNEKEDLFAAIEFLAAQGVEEFVVFGSSMGGAVALLAAAREERIVRVATLAAVGQPAEVEERYAADCAGWRRDGFIELDEGKLGVAFLEDALQHSVVSAVSILRAPIFVAHGTEDDIVPVSDAHDIASAARNASLHIVDGADHRFSNEVHLRPTLDNIADFLAEF